MRCLVALLIGLALASASAWTQSVSGQVRVVDGDTLAVAGERIRLHGIDAPESGQQCRRASGSVWSCGEQATDYLRQVIGDNPVRCETRDRDRYGRIVAVCMAAGVELNRAMVAAGLALAYRRYAMDYADSEQAAMQARRGMWAGEFVAPWDWRRGVRLPVERVAPAAPDKSCLVKGNISSKGERIYHVPGSRMYDRTRIDEAKGERWFCSSEEALAAGWRAAGK